MLDKEGFDLWSKNYNNSTIQGELKNKFPFAGYSKVLTEIYNIINTKSNAEILDIGFGTGTLTSELYKNGHKVTGLDFSTKMLEVAKEKMPDANLLQWDMNESLHSKLPLANMISLYLLTRYIIFVMIVRLS